MLLPFVLRASAFATEEEVVAVKIEDNKHEIDKLKKQIKEEITVELKEDILKEIQKELKNTKKKR